MTMQHTTRPPRSSRLLDAAPDLLDAAILARRALATAVIAHSGGLYDEDSVGEHLVIAHLDAAIAKARGA